MDMPQEALWIPYGDNFQEAYVKEWEQEVHAPDSPVQESGYRWKDPSTWSWHAHGLSDEEIFAHLTRAESGDESESVCEPYCDPKSLDFDYVPYGTCKPTDDGWHTTGESPPVPPGLRFTPQSSWQPYSNVNASQGSWVFRKHVFKQPNELPADMPVVMEPPDVPAPLEPTVPEVIHPVQYGINTQTAALAALGRRNSLSIRDG